MKFAMTKTLMGAAAVAALLASSAFAQDAFHDAAVAEAKRIGTGIEPGSYVEVIDQNSGPEGETLQQVYKAFSEGSGIEIRFTGTPDAAAVVQSRVRAGNPPDVAGIQLGNAMEYASEGVLVNLTDAFGDELKSNFSAKLLETSSNKGAVFGIYQGMNPFMVWYNPQTYKGPKAPKDWKALVDWTNSEAAAGRAVWCAAQNAGPASGFPGAQFIDNLFLKSQGPDLYTKLGSGELSWTSPEVKAAFEAFSAMVGQDSHIQGGVVGALSTSIATGYSGLTSEPATCQLALWGAWTPGLIGDSAKPGVNIDFFRVPASNPEFYKYELFQAGINVGLTDKPTTKAFLRYIASTPAQTYLASLNRWPVANKNVAAETYPSVLLQNIAKQYFRSGDVEFVTGPNMMASSATLTEYWKSAVNYLQNPGDLETILETIQATVAK